MPRTSLLPEVIARIQQLRQDGLTIQEIAKMTGASVSAVRYHSTPGYREQHREWSRDYRRSRKGRKALKAARVRYEGRLADVAP